MSDVTQTKVTYPRLPVSNWWAIRRRFVQSMPKKVDQDWLISVLNLTNPMSATNLLGPLKALGLLDADGNTTPLASEWRDDHDYASACEKIRKRVYPEQLLTLFPPPDPDLADVKRWFMRNAGVGETAGQGMAALYGVICDADVSNQPTASTRGTGTSKPRKAAVPAKAAAKKAAPAVDKNQEPPPPPPPPPPNEAGPNLHIDVQIHIPSDASTEQIDQIFASIGRHLYGRSDSHK